MSLTGWGLYGSAPIVGTTTGADPWEVSSERCTDSWKGFTVWRELVCLEDKANWDDKETRSTRSRKMAVIVRVERGRAIKTQDWRHGLGREHINYRNLTTPDVMQSRNERVCGELFKAGENIEGTGRQSFTELKYISQKFSCHWI